MDQELKVNKKFIELALRNAGYNNYNAIADILDNSLENDVDAKNVNIVVSHEKGSQKVSSINIIDDGVGMSYNTLVEAMSLGSNTGKTIDELGFFGIGLKSASLSMGRRLSVYTKRKDDDLLLNAVFDLDNYDLENEKYLVSYKACNKRSKEYNNFCEMTLCDHGTVVKIDKLDQLSGGSNISQFTETLSKNLRVIFNKFIENDYCSIKINGKKLAKFDVIGNKRYGSDAVLMQTGEIEIDGVYATYKAWNIRQCVLDSKDNEDSYGRGTRHQGIYIYRQNRLVGEALTLGLYNRDPWYNGFKFELFINGNSDKIFHTSFTKMIIEKNKGAIDQSWAKKLSDIMNPLLSIVKDDQKSLSNDNEVCDSVIENVSKALKPLNADNLLKKGLKWKRKNEQAEENDTGNQERRNGGARGQCKPRNFEWVDWKFIKDGETSLMFRSGIENNKNYIYINTDHIFYKEIFSKLDNEMMRKLVILLSMDIQAKLRMGYYDDDDIQRIVDEYVQRISDTLRTAFIGII